MRNKKKKILDWWLSGESTPDDPTFGSDLWIDGTSTDYTSSVDNLGRIVDSLTTKDSNAYVTTAESSGSVFKKPSYNGEGLYFNSNGAFRISNAGAVIPAFNNFHNGTAWTMYLSFKYFSQAQSTTGRNIIDTSGSTITNTRIGFRIDNLNSAADPHTIRVKIFNGTGGTPGIFDVQGTDNCLVDGEYNEIKIVFTGTVLTVSVRNSSNPTFTVVGTDATGSGLVATDSTTTMCVGVEGFGFTGYLKHIIAWYRLLTTEEQTEREAWLATETADVIIPTAVPVYLDWGQSNDDPGTGTDNTTLSGTFPELAVPIPGAFTYRALNSSYTNKTNYWSEVEMSKMTSTSTKHNWILRLAYEMVQAGKTPYFIGAGRGSTGLLDKVASVDWYADGGSVTTGDMFPNWKTIVTDGLAELIHVLRKTPVIYGIGQFQGENDCADAAAVTPAYRLALENWIKSAITFLNGLGYDTSNMHYYLFRTINSGVSAADVRADQAYVMSNFITDFPAYDIQGLTLIDTDAFDYDANHVTNTGQSEAGDAAAAILIPLMP